MAISTITPTRIYKEAFEYCQELGLIKKLEKSFSLSENERFEKLNVSKKGLDLVDAVHCLYDEDRTKSFLGEINKSVPNKSVVVEAGIGTGVLALLAATKAVRVYGLEINPTILKLATRMRDRLVVKKKLILRSPSFSLADATKAILPEKVDVIISENIYTGMFFEKQVEIMNNLLPQLNPGGVVIPERLKSFIMLSDTALPPKTKNKQLFVPSPERSVDFKRTALSLPALYDDLDFTKNSPSRIDRTLRMRSLREGRVNSLVIYSEVLMPSGLKIKRNGTTFLNSDIILAVVPAVQVKKGDQLELNIGYTYGTNPRDAKLTIRKIT